MSSDIDLIIPGLLNLPLHELDADALAASTPNLHRLLRFADGISNRQNDFDDVLIQRLGLSQSALPFAQAMRTDKAGRALLFRPVHLRTDINNAVVFPVVVDPAEIGRLIDDLADYFRDDCDIEALADECWSMTLKNCEPPQQLPHYLSALGKKVTHYQQQARANLEWFKLFNEMQMFLYQHELNQRRLLANEPSINSLWCWGADEYRGEKITYTQWFSDDDGIRQLGRLYGGQAAPLQAIGASDLDLALIVVDLSLLKALKSPAPIDLMRTLEAMEQDIFKPLLARARRPINVLSAGPQNFRYGTAQRLKFWRRPLSLSQITRQALARQPS